MLLLSGPIGSGKTHFARSLIQAKLRHSGQYEEVPSPTYTLVQTYMAGELEILHADLYRIESEFEFAELGLEEAFESALCLVEWPERLPAAMFPCTWKLDFSPSKVSEDLRIIAVEVAEPEKLPLLSQLENFE